MVVRSLRQSFYSGELGLSTAAASDIACFFPGIVPRLKCPLIIEEIPLGFFGEADQFGSRHCDVISARVQRFFVQFSGMGREEWGMRIARLPSNS